jgi:hypothetical protein
VVGALAAAAGGQARVFLSGQRGGKWAKAKEENEEDGKGAPHLDFIVHEGQVSGNGSGNRGVAVSYDRVIRDREQGSWSVYARRV